MLAGLWGCAGTSGAPNAERAFEMCAGFVMMERGDGESRAVSPGEVAGVLALETDAVVAAPGWRAVLRARGDAKLKLEAGVPRLVWGRVRVAFPLGAAEPARMLVSAGRLEARGAVLDVSQGNGVGLARSLEGEARLYANDGRVVAIPSGETTRWPLAPPRP